MFQILPLCPFLLMNKIFSASKLIGDILMSALLTKDENVQKELVKVLHTLSCLSLGTSGIIVTASEDQLGHNLFFLDNIAIVAICSKCQANYYENVGNCEQFLANIKKEVEIYSVSNIFEPSQHSNMMGLRSLFAKFLNANHYVDVESSGFWDLAGTFCHHFFVFDHTAPTLLQVGNTEHVLRALKPFLGADLVSI